MADLGSTLLVVSITTLAGDAERLTFAHHVRTLTKQKHSSCGKYKVNCIVRLASYDKAAGEEVALLGWSQAQAGNTTCCKIHSFHMNIQMYVTVYESWYLSTAV